MEVIKTETGLKLKAENDYEVECLRHISGKSVVATFDDVWDQKGDLKLEFKQHPWDEK